jgi:hypothetical protein
MHGEVIAMRKLRQGQGVQYRESSADFRSEEWIDNKVVGCEFEDVRHGKRLRQLLQQLSHRVGATTHRQAERLSGTDPHGDPRQRERDTLKDREKIDWKLLADLPVRTRREAAEKLDWYAQRWKIETFHKILKSGCRAEEAKLRTAERLVSLIAILCILSWRIF